MRVVRLMRPEKRNALTPAMLDELYAAVTRTDDAGAIVLAGAGKVFCAGFDLALCMETPDGGTMRALLGGLSRVVAALRGGVLPVVAAAHGAALAGGCALLGGADLVVTDAHASLGYPVLRIGISPAVSGPFLMMQAGDAAARARMLDSGLIDGKEAARVGLAHHCVQRADEVLPRAVELAVELARKPRHAMMQTRAWVRHVEVELCGEGGLDRVEWALQASLAGVGGAEETEMMRAALAARKERA